MSLVLYNVLERPFIPKHTFEPKTKQVFKIKMDNYYLNSMGRVYKLQELNSCFTRTIEEIYEDSIVFSSYQWDKIIFTNKVPKKPVTPIDWTFVKGCSFQSHLVLSNEKLEELCVRNNSKVSAEDNKNCFNSIGNAYEGFPKLPSIYLVVMQTFDIVAFESYLSYIYTNTNTNKGWKLDEWVKIEPPELEHMQETNIGLGFYSENSFFRNGKFFLKLTGYGKANNRPCAVFDYYCDFSQVRMQEKDSSDVQRNGTSYYHGQIWLNIDRGDLERGTMLESYIALQEGATKTPVHIRRRVLCEALTGGQ